MSESEAAESLKFENEHLKLSVAKYPHCRTVFEIVAAPKFVVDCYPDAFKNVRKEVSIPGFRKGKAPENLVREQFKKSIDKEAVDLFIDRAMREAMKMAEMFPSDRPGSIKSIRLKEFSQEKGGEFHAEFERRTRTPSIDLNAQKFQAEAPEAISEQMIDERLHMMSKPKYSFEPIEDRGVQRGDYIDLTFTLKGDAERTLLNHQRIVVDAPQLPEWLIARIEGLHSGSTLEGLGEVDDRAGTIFTEPRPFSLEVHGIWKGIAPAIDDAFAKSCGSETLEQLREGVRKSLEEEQEEVAFEKNLAKLEDHLLAHYPVDVPQSVIDEFLQQHQEAGPISDEKKERMIRAIALSFLLRKTIHEHRIQPTDSVVQRVLRLLIAERSPHLFRYLQGEDTTKQYIQELATTRAAEEFLIAHLGA